MSQGTYLESFIDHIATLPHEVRRNLELMRDMDKSCSLSFEEMTRLQQEYIARIEDKMDQLEVVVDDDDGTMKVRVLAGDGGGSSSSSSSSDQEEEEEDGSNKVASVPLPTVIPTTEELLEYVHDKDGYRSIEKVQEDCLQRAEEKVAIADQTYSLVDNICKRLDSDVTALEKLLQSAGEFQAPGSAKPNDLAAIQVTPGSPDWILAKVIKHDVRTGMYELADEDTESNKIFSLPEPQVVILNQLKNLTRGDVVFAVYPDTTSFYQATVVQAPRKVSGGGSFVMVHFIDDSDEHGITHDKAVLTNHVMRPPYGVTLQ